MLKARISAHLSNIRRFKNTSIARHFNSPDHIVQRDFKIAIIDAITPSINGLNIREATWIHHLDTIAKGINEKDEARIGLDYQTLAVAQHFRHSKTCLPKITSTIKDISTLSLNQYKRLPWVRTRYPNQHQSNAASLPHVPHLQLQSSAAPVPHASRPPHTRGTLYPMFTNSITHQQRFDINEELSSV
jgi:hypothetical protein